MSDRVSVLIPSREERFLTPTIHDVFRNARGEAEVVVHLDGYWPGDWKELTAQYPNLHTVHSGQSVGMRGGINKAAASAITRGAKYLFKLDAHCSLGEGFDEILKVECDDDWVVVPRRLRLDPENWTIAEPDKPPHDYHYLSFPDDPQDFGGPGLNGKPWVERQRERANILLDEEMSSQGSAWFMHADHFQRLELMDDVSYGPFWNEFQEIGLKCWLSGGKVMVNKRTHYAHLHKGKKYGRGYRLDESALTQGRNHTMKWIWNEAWAKQTLPFKWLIEHFWPVPTWPENWEEVLYAQRKPRDVSRPIVPDLTGNGNDLIPVSGKADEYAPSGGLQMHRAFYGVKKNKDQFDFSGGEPIDVTERVRQLVKDNSLDIIVNNSTLTPNQNPFRGKRKTLSVVYSYDGGEQQLVQRAEKEWVIIGQAQRQELDVQTIRENLPPGMTGEEVSLLITERYMGQPAPVETPVRVDTNMLNPPPLSAPALNDYLIRKFSISPQRLKAPMPIELNSFHRNDLAQLFAELGFTKGCEVGVAEGRYSEILLKANPDCHLLLVDPWHAYSGNPQNKSKEKNEFAYNETLRRTKPYPNVKIDMRYSMDAVRDVEDGSLDFVYLDGHHSYPFIMSDLIFWSQKVRSGGIVSGDDVYQLNEKWGAGPAEAVYDYTRAMRINPWFLISGHKSVDFFFVKP